ncbi:deazaflavin-dependent oxidoreductase (nitroreductase family) [Phycicoccus badiiscoriae]|uniref:Deazaflavin-dependent oxidoreductase (Nitroreductase family) n=1 Tax=Pedococcus badiiscoriae TaxID=642776 RepID=A0A852WHK5_9MICO|nr:nitroreductase family deazaflavin-dependent oxidoreductase [Pedococcus badiiscoriae]NYG05745.1 deazaflavin-dependent oxidoreductase (nitroreductase family) [Pedococcus badiiscoriae]
MTITGEYAPSTSGWVRDQVEQIEAAGTTRAVSIQDRPVVMLTMLGLSGKVRKVPLMRVEHDGLYAAVASKGGAPEHPKWYANIRKNPVLDLQDDDRTWTVRARELDGAEREQWWARCVEAFPSYADYQVKTDRLIPVFVLEPVETAA